MQIHLIDGTYELFRAYFAVPKSPGPAGVETAAARGLFRSFAAWLRSGRVTHAAVAFDTVIESFRNRLFDGYKTGEGLDPDLFGQFPLAERVTRALGLVTWSMIEFEADDALAAFAARAESDPEVERVLITTPDKDLAQCVRGTRVVCYDRARDAVLDEAGVETKFGVRPESIPDFLALVGDAADGIPGVPRWGKKSAAAVLHRFGTIESIPKRAADWGIALRGADALALSLVQFHEQALLYKKLATLRLDVPLEEMPQMLEWKGARRDELRALAEEIGEDGALDRVTLFRDE
ncbi:MAG TPA: 5'-3' exonuclease H3TH domain-containing protein [Polyangiaceae bacterium]|nr:5'-3' exonuclease H3TH domain-containing protein [Polyangiaceae bacterium]